MVYVGIDLGTTYSCVAVVENGKSTVIFNEDGKNVLPSVAAYHEKGVLVGNSALNCNTDLSNILYDSKRLLGWHVLSNLPIAKNRELWTFNVDTRNNYAGYVLSKGSSSEQFVKPEEVSAEILKKLKASAEKYLHKSITGVVVTIPAFFQTDQINATKKAIELAGLDLKYLLQEPTAAAIAYNEHRKLENTSIMCFDFGGGTLDVTIAEIVNEKIIVKAVSGDSHLGGQDLDGKIMKYVIENFSKTSKYDIYNRPKILKRLRTVCREAKEALSFNVNAYDIHLDINDDLEIHVQLTLDKFNELGKEIFDKSINLIDNALNTAQLKALDIGNVIVVGGTTRIPMIRKLLENKFERNKLKFDINPDEAVAHGAAIIAKALDVGAN